MSHSTSLTDPAEFWEERYLNQRRESGRVWSGQVNAAVEHEIRDLKPGTALELGSGEGADALWLAARGWTVTAIDISSTALAVGAAQADEEGLTERIVWEQADLATWHPSTEYDLVTTAFLHSPVTLPRKEILRRALSTVAPGGRLLVVGHAEIPAGMGNPDHDAPPLPTSDEVLASLELPDSWVVETNGVLERKALWRDGRTLDLVDSVVRVRRGH
jgi:predicted O-methyltransferase YrrM